MALTTAERDAWQAGGYFVVRNLFSPVELSVLQAEAERLLAAADAELQLLDDQQRQEGWQEGSIPVLQAQQQPNSTRRYMSAAAGSNGNVTLPSCAENEELLGIALVATAQVWNRVGELLGPDFVFAGSECNRAGAGDDFQGWHSDRGILGKGSDQYELDCACAC